MFGKGIKLFRLFGFTVKADWSWLLIFALVTWSLAAGYLPWQFPDYAQSTYWILGVIGAVCIFGSIIFHELMHSMVARRYGMKISGITLFIFGGVAGMEEEPPNPKTEFRMAAAGPLSSIALGGLFLLVGWIARNEAWHEVLAGTITHVGYINLILAGFNLFPGFPLDGGRMLRAWLWSRKNNLKRATAVASEIGAGFGLALIIVGILNFFMGSLIGGLWWILIGLFLRSAAKGSYQQTLFKEMLKGQTVSKFMNDSPVTVTPSQNIQTMLEDYVYKYHHRFYPVTDNGAVKGCVEIDRIKDLSAEERARTNVSEITSEVTDDNTVRRDDEAIEAFRKMHKSKNHCLMVLGGGGDLVGVLSTKDLMGYLNMRMQMEQELEI